MTTTYEQMLVAYRAAITPREGFAHSYTLTVTAEHGTANGVAWVGTLRDAGRKVADVEHRGDGGAPFVIFADRADRATWRSAVADAYGDEWAEESFIAFLDLASQS